MTVGVEDEYVSEALAGFEKMQVGFDVVNRPLRNS